MLGFALNPGQELLNRQTAQNYFLVGNGRQIYTGQPGHLDIIKSHQRDVISAPSSRHPPTAHGR